MALRLNTLVLLLVLAEFPTLFAQETNVRQQTSANIVYFEHYYFQTDSTITVIIPFSIRSDFFVFTKSLNTNGELYTASGEVSVELLDSTGTSVDQNFRHINIKTNDNSSTHLRTIFKQDLFTFTVPPGTYQIMFKVEDKESKRIFSNAKEQIRVLPNTRVLSSPIPVQYFENESFQLFNLGGDVQFSQNYGFVLLSKNQYTSVKYTLIKKQAEDDDDEIIDSTTMISVLSKEAKTFQPAFSNNAICLNLNGSANTTVNYIALNGSQLRQGRYEIEFIFPDSTKVKTQFGARWLDMPMSLNDLDLATEPLQFILTKSDYSELRRGGRESRIRKFDEFWKKKDTTPLTAYNEVMHEFYRRVDYAVSAFRTLREMNGAITDRGRIYILYGKPTTTERTLSPNGSPKEIWKYSSSNKTFTFEDPSKQGNYKLAENK
jgi:GWxTD domain-containing protein